MLPNTKEARDDAGQDCRKNDIFLTCFTLPFQSFSFLSVVRINFCCSVAQLCPTLFVTPWTAARQTSLSFTISKSLIKLMPIELVMPPSHLICCCPLILLPSIFLSIRVFSNELALHIRWPKYWSFSFSISPSKQRPRQICFRMGRLDLLHSKGLSRVFSNTTVQKHQFFGAQLSSESNSHIHTWPLEKPYPCSHHL